MVEVLFINGNVWTMDERNSQAGCVAVENGVITGVWQGAIPPEEDVVITDEMTVVDLKGDTLLPGFIDTHNHILMYGLLKKHVNCSTPLNESIDDVLQLLANKASETKNGEWIQGYGFDDTLIAEGKHLTRKDLDQACPSNPVIVRHISGHLASVNTLALEYAGLDDFATEPDAGHFGRDERGRLNGVLYEPGAMNPIVEKIPAPTVEEMVDALQDAANDYVAQGITTNSDAAVSGLDELKAHVQAAKRRVNPMRSRLMMMHYLLGEGAHFGLYTPEQLNEELMLRSDGLVQLDSVKMFQDGSIQGLTGALRKPYHKYPDVLGDFIHEQGPFQEEVLDLHKRGFRITIHGNGDRAIGSILDAYYYAIDKYPRTDHRHRIEHVQSATTEDIEKMRQLGVAGSFFINHVYYWGDRHERIFLGPERAQRISPLAEAVNNQLLFTLHSDCPVTPISPLFSVWAAVNRTTREGRTLGPEQRIDVITALKAMTIYGAVLNFEEDHSGSIEIGKKADFVVLAEDPVAVQPETIKDITVKATFINGEMVYENINTDTER
ncbi:amidohydrolase [Pontibacillus litoralis]|uniref:Hydrolase n=1 Tax=Pontibacillus litoralis JSM 072002 TaxID=1385512 RepID=A0A0A5FYF2_9BACI|nr:amidohydrolase [Pontibacillus litoralis]KGX85846.1 hydrolase [Pontibacillus litoralis JSM 072002]